MFNRQIRRGIRALTKHFGNKRWARRIRLSRLDLGINCACVAGQLFGNYGWMPSNDLPDPYDLMAAQKYGFHAGEDKDDDVWDRLTSEWKEELRKLR